MLNEAGSCPTDGTPSKIILAFRVTLARKSVDYATNAAMIHELAPLSDRENYQTLMQSPEIGDCKTFDLYQCLRQLLSHENLIHFSFHKKIL